MRRSLLTVVLLFLPATAPGQAAVGAVFTGTVLDSVKQPLANAEVSLPAFSIRDLTNDKGQFRLVDIPAGTHRVLIRRIGFGQLDTAITFAENQTVERRITLGRITTLDSIVTKANMPDPLLVEFDENRARGFETFITRDELEKRNGQTMGAIMSQVHGLNVMRGVNGQAWVTPKRGPMTRCASGAPQRQSIDDCFRSEGMYYVPEMYEKRMGMQRACFSRVYLDRILANSGRPTYPFDLNSLSSTQIEAIEWYADGAQTPPKYNAVASACGVLIIHRRR